MSHPARSVFVGDSTTDGDRDRSDPASLGEGYGRLPADALAGRPGAPDGVCVLDAGVCVLDAGVSGDRALDLAARWHEDALAAGARLEAYAS
ncbi:hypothetical protein IT072_01920 [Leifsonia sp. ZF2019]|uniref:hypothetical protein n=1 Tax=Leifsonia sp. ZF2019 TaxID=2781978 RepID=UPI001CC09D0C|nr:hypothetical protein [Leifsonia sp. ZF2019]UAJ79860.1 hypothetical protein IT072_01920 [Leifsonia sp. ZF2019]